MSQPRALIIGGSLGGLIAAHLLRSVGWDAVVFERNAVDLPSRGAGIGTHSHLIDVLRRIGIPFEVAEKCLNHKLDGIVETYDQHDYTKEMAAAFEKWSDHIAGVIK